MNVLSKTLFAGVVACALTLGMTGCDDEPTTTDTTADAGDTNVDSGADIAEDVAIDAPTETSIDTGPDSVADTAVDTVIDTPIEETTDAVEETTDTVEETTDTVEETTDAVEETTDAVEETTDTVEETTDTVEETTDAVEETTDTVEETTDTGEETTDAGEETTDTVEETADTGGETSTATCDYTGYVPVEQDGNYINAFGAFLYVAQDTNGAPVTTLNMELVDVIGGASAPGTYTLTDDDYSNCANCVLIWKDCDGDLSNCTQTFLATSGTLTLDAYGKNEGDNFNGTLTDVVLEEVTVNAGVSTPVVDGETWCLPSYAFSTIVQ